MISLSSLRLRRVHWVMLGFAVASLIMLWRAWTIQVSNAACLQKQAEMRHIRVLKLAAPRGEIYERNGKVLALSTPVADIVVDPYLICRQKARQALYEEQQERLRAGLPLREDEKPLPAPPPDPIPKLAELLSLDQAAQQALEEKVLSRCSSRFMYVKRQVRPDVARRIRDAGLTGVLIREVYKRFYPQGEIFAHLVGFTDIDGRGQAGLERSYETRLKGHQGQIRLIKDRQGRIVEFYDQLRPLKAGQALHLTLDHRIQYYTYVALKRAMKQHQAKSAAAVVLDARTGEILALASQPGFNPNNRAGLKPELFRNHAISDWIEPGSTVKPLVMAYALSRGIVRPGEQIDTRPGRLKIQENAVVKDDYNKGVLSLTKIIQKSSNVGMAKIALRMRVGRLLGLYRKLGFDEPSGLNLHAEQAGRLRRGWGKVDHVWASFGYGIHVNLLQLARAFLPLANEGWMLPLRLERSDEPPKRLHQVYRKWAVERVLRMMETVVQKGGTAPDAALPRYRVAGKTGTVHKRKKGRRGYSAHTYQSLFVGLVPARRPDMIMAVVVDEPSRGKYFGGEVAAPVFREVMMQALRVRNVAPDW